MALHSRSRVTVPHPERYAATMCKHFAHKLTARFEGDSGLIEFPFATCRLATAGDVLTMDLEAANLDDLARGEEVVKSHLERFTFKEKPEIAWVRD